MPKLYTVLCERENLGVVGNVEFKTFYVIAYSFGQAEDRTSLRLGNEPDGFKITMIELNKDGEVIEKPNGDTDK